VSEAEVLDGRRFLSDAGFNPASIKSASRAWLDNFEQADRELAVHLLEAFILIPNSMTDALLQAAFHQLAPSVCGAGGYELAPSSWTSFRNEILVTIPTGEIPNPTDSGYSFQRSVRQRFGIDEAQIVEPADAIARLANRGSGTVVFVDDFVGSGHQFVQTWNRAYEISPSRTLTFGDVCQTNVAIYVPLVATESGVAHIESNCATAEVRAVHVLGPEYSANSATSSIWQSAPHDDAVAFVEKYTVRAGFPVSEAWGYGDLALAFAFEHGTPDATLPILYSERGSWRPLVRRR